MGARQAEHPVEIRRRGQETGDLGFLAAHDVRRVGLRHAGGDPNVETRVSGGRADKAGRIEGRAGRCQIGRLGPALPRADHAGGEDKRAAFAKPWPDQAKEGRFEIVLAKRAHAVVR